MFIIQRDLAGLGLVCGSKENSDIVDYPKTESKSSEYK